MVFFGFLSLSEWSSWAPQTSMGSHSLEKHRLWDAVHGTWSPELLRARLTHVSVYSVRVPGFRSTAIFHGLHGFSIWLS